METAQEGTGANKLTPTELSDLRLAKQQLENPHLVAQMADIVGKPVEVLVKKLPEEWNKRIGEISQTALLKGLNFALYTMRDKEVREARDRLHKVMVTGSGAIGGVFGLWSLPVELPLSTCLMLRSIADIARSEGHDINRLEIKLSCLEVFALGSRNSEDDAAESGYWVVRGALAKQLADAAAFIAEKGFVKQGAPPIVRFISPIAARFSTLVTDQVAAKAVPFVAAATGSTINLLFLRHFQDMAHGHFTIKRLEDKYGTAYIEEKYQDI